LKSREPERGAKAPVEREFGLEGSREFEDII